MKSIMGKSLPNKIFIIAGPSGSGKTTLAKHVLDNHPEMAFLHKAVTREKPGDVPGKEVVRLTTQDFLEMSRDGRIVGCYEKYGSWYGWFLRSSNGTKGIDALEYSACLTIGDAYHAPTELIKLVPETVVIVLHARLDVLKERIRAKGIDTVKEQRRISTVTMEYQAGYPWNVPICHHVVSTEQPPESAGKDVLDIIEAESVDILPKTAFL